MALDSNVTGAAIAAYVKRQAPGPGMPVTATQLVTLWQGIMSIIYTDLETNAEVLPGSFIAPSGGGPISGIGGPLE